MKATVLDIRCKKALTNTVTQHRARCTCFTINLLWPPNDVGYLSSSSVYGQKSLPKVVKVKTAQSGRHSKFNSMSVHQPGQKPWRNSTYARDQLTQKIPKRLQLTTVAAYWEVVGKTSKNRLLKNQPCAREKQRMPEPPAPQPQQQKGDEERKKTTDSKDRQQLQNRNIDKHSQKKAERGEHQQQPTVNRSQPNSAKTKPGMPSKKEHERHTEASTDTSSTVESKRLQHPYVQRRYRWVRHAKR